MKIEYLPHTADIRMRVIAASIPDLFTAAMRGMSDVLSETSCEEPIISDNHQELSLQSRDLTCLLVDFLSEVLTLSYTEKCVFCELEIREQSPEFLKARIGGKPVDGFTEEIKAVTYHEAEVVQNDDGLWFTNVVFDI